MLVIQRHEGQTVLVGDDVEILIIECGGRRVKLGFRAPRQVAVTRGEVKLTREQNLAASEPVSPAALREVGRRLPVLAAGRKAPGVAGIAGLATRPAKAWAVPTLGGSSGALDAKVVVAKGQAAAPDYGTSSPGVGKP
ncbi:MAG: carbon storage regulator [Bryobacteraceae bacterium]|jgi:carbon storage regulator